jgi:hypothetical protein
MIEKSASKQGAGREPEEKKKSFHVSFLKEIFNIPRSLCVNISMSSAVDGAAAAAAAAGGVGCVSDRVDELIAEFKNSSKIA